MCVILHLLLYLQWNYIWNCSDVLYEKYLFKKRQFCNEKFWNTRLRIVVTGEGYWWLNKVNATPSSITKHYATVYTKPHQSFRILYAYNCTVNRCVYDWIPRTSNLGRFKFVSYWHRFDRTNSLAYIEKRFAKKVEGNEGTNVGPFTDLYGYKVFLKLGSPPSTKFPLINHTSVWKY